MPTNVKVKDLKINTLTEAQYDAAVQSGVIGENELSIITDGEENFVPQLDILPEATESDAGKIVQYIGETIPDSEASATITQTVGSGLTNLEVNIEKFEEAEQPTEDITVEFHSTGVKMPFNMVVGNNITATANDIALVNQIFMQRTGNHAPKSGQLFYNDIDQWYFRNDDGTGIIDTTWDSETGYISEFNITIGGDISNIQIGDYFTFTYDAEWFKDSTKVNIADYGITYSGFPENNDVVEVDYSMFKSGITNGYFYKNQPDYTDPVTTIAQTAGRADSAVFETTVGETTLDAPLEVVMSYLNGFASLYPLTSGTMTFVYNNPANNVWGCTFDDDCGSHFNTAASQANYEEQGFVFTGTPQQGDTIVCTYAIGTLHDLTINQNTFIAKEHPTQSTNYVFIAETIEESIDPTQFSFDMATIEINQTIFLARAHSDCYASSWDNISYVYFEYNGEYNSFRVAACDANGVICGECGGINPDVWGLTITGNLPVSGTYSTNLYYTHENTIWKLNSNIINIQDYGISYTGTPVTGDALTVAYTAPLIIGYSWNQINVQDGENKSSGIEWQDPIVMTKENDDSNQYYPYIHILNPESGTYSFYVKILRLVNGYGAASDSNNILGYLVYKVSFDYDSTKVSIYDAIKNGQIGLVYNGDTQIHFSNTNPINSDSYVHIKKAEDGTLWIQPDNALECDAMLYMENGQTEQMMQISKIYKDEIAVEAECQANKSDFWSTIPEISSISIVRSSMIDRQTIYQRVIETYQANSINDNPQFMMGGGSAGTEFYVSITTGNDRFVAKLYRQNSKINIFEQEILTATGKLAQCEFRHNKTNPILYFGETRTFIDDVIVVIGMNGIADSTNVQLQLYPTTESSDSVPLIYSGKSYKLLTPEYNNLGGIHQYIGETNANYTKGYFYKATGTPIIVPASVTFINFNPNDVMVTVTDADAFVTALNNVGGWGESWVKERLQQDWTQFNLVYNFDTGIISRVYWNYYGDIYDQALFDCFNITTTGSYSGQGDIQIEFVCYQGYTPAHYGVSNPSWDRVDVQPGAAIQVDDLPEASASQVGKVYQYIGTTGINYTHGYFYECSGSAERSATASQTSGSGLTNINVDIDTFETQISVSGSYDFMYDDWEGTWMFHSEPVNLADYGITYTGTPNDFDTITVVYSTGGGFAWNQVDVQPAPVIPDPLPSQTGNSGKFLTTDGTDTSWSDKPLVNTATYQNTCLSIGTGNPTSVGSGALNIGRAAKVTQSGGTALGAGADVRSQGGTAVGSQAYITSNTSTGGLALGKSAFVDADGAIQLDGSGSNSYQQNHDANTFKVANANGNFEIMSADGTVPTARLTKVNTTVTLAAANWSSNTQTVNVTGMTTTGIVLVNPTPANQSAYTNAGILCTAQGTGTLTFTCDTTPTADIDVVVVML